MATIERTLRKTSVLRHPGLPCLQEHYTINLTAGCPFDCRYCYAQSFRHHPGVGKVIFYANSLELLRKQFPRMRNKPRLVYFSTACEPFAPYPEILDTLYDAMELLLSNRVFVLISTKSRIPDRFISLLERHAGMVSVEVGLTTVDDGVRAVLEPNAFPVEQRLSNLRRLNERGIQVKAKMDPLIPGLTDSDESVSAVFKTLETMKVGNAVASFLFLRRALMRRMNFRHDGWAFGNMVKRIYTQIISDYCGGSIIRVPATEYKRERFGAIRQLASEHNVRLTFCGCKNPDVTADRCHAQPPPVVPRPTLFD